MKNIFNLSFLLLLTFNFFAQEGTIVSLCSISSDLPSGTYIKDINNESQYYIGTWQGIHNNTTIALQIDFYSRSLNENANGLYFYEDRLKGRYKVLQGLPNTTLNPDVLFSSMHISDFRSMPLFSTGFENIAEIEFGNIDFGNIDFERCNIEGDLKLVRNLSNPNELQYRFHISPAIIFPTADCPFTNGIVPVPLPSYCTHIN